MLSGLSICVGLGPTFPKIFKVAEDLTFPQMTMSFLNVVPQKPTPDPRPNYLQLLDGIPYVSDMLETKKRLLEELGLWASELFFSHALDHLACLIEHQKIMSAEGLQLSADCLNPLIMSAAETSRSSPVQAKASTSPKVQSLLKLIKDLPDGQRFQGIILTSCPMVAIYLEKVLNPFLLELDIYSETAVRCPVNFTEPLASKAHAFSRYVQEDVQVLVSTHESISQFKQSTPHLVFFDYLPSALVMLDSALTLSPTRMTFLSKRSQKDRVALKLLQKLLPWIEDHPQIPPPPQVPSTTTPAGAKLTHNTASYLITTICHPQMPNQGSFYKVKQVGNRYQACLTLTPPISLSTTSSDNCISPLAAKDEAAYHMCCTLYHLRLLDKNLLLL